MPERDYMNAAEIIEEIARLPEDEQGKILAFVRRLPNAETLAAINESADDLSRYKTMDEASRALKGLVHDA